MSSRIESTPKVANLSAYLSGCQTTNKVGQRLWAWFSCPKKIGR